MSHGPNVTLDVTIGSKCHSRRSELGRNVQAAKKLGLWIPPVSLFNLSLFELFENKLVKIIAPKMTYSKISKDMSLYFGLDVFCLFEARVPQFDTQPLPPDSCGSVQCTLRL